MTVEVTSDDEQALRACLRNTSGGVKVHELRRLLGQRIGDRTGRGSWDPEVNRLVRKTVTRLLAKWRDEGLIDNPVRGRWEWVRRASGATEKRPKDDE